MKKGQHDFTGLCYFFSDVLNWIQLQLIKKLMSKKLYLYDLLDKSINIHEDNFGEWLY